MDVQSTLATGILLAVFTLIWSVLGRGQFRAIDKRFDAADRRFEAIDQQFVQIRGEIVQVRSEIAELRSDLLHVALAVGAQPRPRTG